jgi:hypothetical protein
VTNDHLSLDELAELDEGLLPPERTSAVRAHLHGCEQCRARADAITSTRSLLASLPAEPMPAAVKARLDRVIAEEAGHAAEEAGSTAEEAGRATEAVGSTAEQAGSAADAGSRTPTVVPNVVSIPRRRFGRPTMAASAAAAAVVLAVGAIIWGSGHHANHSTESAGAASTGGQPLGLAPQQTGTFTTSSTGKTYTLNSLPTDVSSLLTVKAAPALAAPVPGAASATSPKASATSARGGRSAASHGPASHAVPKALLPLYSSPQKLLACAAFVTPTAGALPIAVDFGRWSAPPFHRAPSVIFVFAGSATTVRVVVVGPSCAGDAVRKFTEVALPK